MSRETDTRDPGDVGPGFMDAVGLTIREGIARYVIGFVLACALTAASFYVLNTSLILGAGNSGCARRARRRTDQRASSVLSAHRDGSRQHQQRAGAGFRRADSSRW